MDMNPLRALAKRGGKERKMVFRFWGKETDRKLLARFFIMSSFSHPNLVFLLLGLVLFLEAVNKAE